MTTDALTLSQLLSPNFPVGAFAYSHGLEMAVDDGFINNSITLDVFSPEILTTAIPEIPGPLDKAYIVM